MNQKINIDLDINKQDNTWKKYGHVTTPIEVTQKGTLYPSTHKAWFKDGKFKTFLSKNYVLYPHQEVENRIKEVLETDEMKNFKEHSKYEQHNGDTKFWTLLSDERMSIENNDNIRLGVVIRNGLGTDVALGVDIYTYRLVCSNGAVARGKNLGTISISHIGKTDRVTKLFEDAIRSVFYHAKELVKYYKKSTQIEVNEALANKMYKKLANLGELYLPDNWKVPSVEKVNELRKTNKFEDVNLVRLLPTVNKKPLTLWETFNIITAKQRDRLNNDKVSFGSIAAQQNLLHKTLIEVVKSH